MKLLIVDKDNTLIKPKSGAKFVQSPDDQELLPGVFDRVQEAKDQGAIVIVASNQGGVASRHKTLDATLDEFAYLIKLLPQIDYCLFAHTYENLGYGECIKIDASDSGFQWKLVTNGEWRFRKPNPGMINLAMKLAEVDRENALMIGDREEDRLSAEAANVPFLWAQPWTDPSLPF
jgi:D-glycero-D-manno-heptose 1,7-bisphosphate phosphatase